MPAPPQPQPGRPRPIADLLFSQGFGTRRECAALVAAGAVRVAGRTVDDPTEAFEPAHLTFEVSGQTWQWQARVLVLLHKPAGHECSQKPSAWPSVIQLLPAPLRRRGVQPIGRLDQDTTGLLLLTDDGALIHRLASPRYHVPKVYEARTARPVEPTQLQALLQGVVLRDDPQPVRADTAEAIGSHALRLQITQGRYHQVKRMIAAVGNHCEALHRSRFAGLDLRYASSPGQWHFVDEATRLSGLGV